MHVVNRFRLSVIPVVPPCGARSRVDNGHVETPDRSVRQAGGAGIDPDGSVCIRAISNDGCKSAWAP